jgi:hypothetical protein
MPYFGYVRDGVVKYVQLVTGSTPAHSKWLALNRSGVILKDSSNHDVMPGDLFTDGKFYKKDAETNETTLVEDGTGVLPEVVRVAGIVDGEVVGQWGMGVEAAFEDLSEANQFIDDIVNSQIVEIEQEQQFLVEKGWLYDGANFTNPNNA